MTESSFLWDEGAGGDQSPHTEADVIALFKALTKGAGVIGGYLNTLKPSVSGANLLINTGWAMSISGHPYRNDASKSTTIATPVVGTTGHRIVLREDTAAQTVRIFDIASADGTAAIPAAAGTDVTLCTLTITTVPVITMTDAREFAGGLAEGPLIPGHLGGYSTTTYTFASNTAMQVGTIEVPHRMLVTRLQFAKTAVGTSGSLAIAIWSNDGQTRHINEVTASISGAGTAVISVVLATPVVLEPSIYYIGVVAVATANVTATTWAQGAVPNDAEAGAGYNDVGQVTVAAGTPPATFDPDTDVTAVAGRTLYVRFN